MEWNAVAACEFNSPKVQDLRTMSGEFQGLFLRDRAEAMRLGNDARVCGEQSVNVGVDLAHIGAEGGGQGDGGRIGASATQGRDILSFGDALEACDDGDLAFADGAGDAFGHHTDDLGPTVVRVRFNARLGTGVGLSVDAKFINGH